LKQSSLKESKKAKLNALQYCLFSILAQRTNLAIKKCLTMDKCFDENVKMKEITIKYNSSLLDNKYPIDHQFC